MREVVALRSVAKSFGATRALNGVSLAVREGEVHALVGENGAGKSTLMNVLAGVVRPGEGDIFVNGTPRRFHDTHDAKAAGIVTVFQELSLCDGLSVAENICAGATPARFGLVDRRAMRARAIEALNRLGVAMPVDGRVAKLRAGQKQTVEIAKALDQLFHSPNRSGNGAEATRLLILDEPTSAINAQEKERLFDAIRDLKAQGVGIVYVSHHLAEVLALADRITVLRDGATIWTKPACEVDIDTLVRAMVGREVRRDARARTAGTTIAARFRDVAKAGQLADVSFDLFAGEILAVVGLDGSGRESIARLLAGIETPDRGAIEIGGAPHPGSLRAAMRRGVAYVPDDRKEAGLFLDLPVAANALAADLGSVSRAGFVRSSALKAEGTQVIRRYGVKAEGPGQKVRALSGGNQQKILFAKWLRRDPALLVVEEPTKGVDIGAKHDIHDRIVAHARGGAAVLLVSSDLPESIELADRILVLHRGRLAAVLDGGTATEEAIMAFASGAPAATAAA